MPTTTPNPAELAAAEVKRLACNMAEAWSEYNQPHQSTAKFWDVYQTALKTMCAAINQLRDLASGPSAEAVAVGQIEEEPARSAPNAAGGYQTIPAKLYVKWSPVMPPVGTKLYAAPAATPPAEKEVRAAALAVVTARNNLGWCTEVDEAIAKLSGALGATVERKPLDIESAAKKLAELFDYPWSWMPDEGRENMRSRVRTVIEAAGIQGEGS